MNKTLALTALLMGLAGGPHCLAMCGAACAGIGRAAQKQTGGQGAAAMLLFQLGRIAGYSALGALAATTMQGVGWLSTQSAVFRPLWTLLHIVAFIVGVLLLWRGEQPIWLEGVGRSIWRRVQAKMAHLKLRNGGAVILGVLWALMPCGLLYGALLVAALSNSPLEGAGAMALFALGSAVVLTIGPWAWLRLRGVQNVDGRSGAWGVRLAGLALAISSGWALWMGLVEYQAPWCLVPQ
ncbi:sulfite exporter TauE/SafE family protein [Limnohabitans sp.]|uniref:sulfite exporter TauE/SafE family protein n=1 Tax=Limnohabitans sp. TaxID=1907725 RepID=UPI00286F5E04|nr:sulfite exporter TauE/SafE family protein [Limnohabitans sp.]